VTPYRIYIGWDARVPEVYEVAKFSLMRRASIPVAVHPIEVAELRERGLYWRDADPLASTEFTYSRFLTPFLAGHAGWALYCDCDFLWLDDIANLLPYTRTEMALYCVQHDYRPTEATKMDGAVQTIYPRKNWSSLMLINCGHPAVRALTPDVVNTESGSYLHRFQWLDDSAIGALPVEWNWLEGWNATPVGGMPKAVHFTRGGPWLEQWRNIEYADLWLAERDAMMGARASSR
jgi:hypothetical protein